MLGGRSIEHWSTEKQKRIAEIKRLQNDFLQGYEISAMLSF